MELEQKSPNGPNFGLIVGLACATILILFVVAIFLLKFEGGRFNPLHKSKNPNAMLVMPASALTDC